MTPVMEKGVWDVGNWTRRSFPRRVRTKTRGIWKRSISRSDMIITLVGMLLSVSPVQAETNGAFRSVDISAACNMGFQDEVAGDQKGGFTDQGEINLGQIPLGEVEFKGVKFNIINPSQNNGKSCIVLSGSQRSYFPKQAFIPVKAKAASVCFLHTAAWCGTDRKAVAKYEIAYDDGIREQIVLRRGIEMTDWGNWTEPEGSHKVWKGKTAVLGEVGLNLFVWANPHPEKTIDSITFRSLETEAVPALIAVSLSDKRLKELEKTPNLSVYMSDQTKMVAFELAPLTEDIGKTALDFSFLLDPPAGKHGFVTSRDGHFYFDDGTRARFWGVGFGTKSCFMPHAMAEKIARHLATMGFNMVRLAGIAGPTAYYEGSRASIVDGKWRVYHEENWDLLDYFIFQLKQNGIYVHLDIDTSFMMIHPDIVKKEGEIAHRLQHAAVFDPTMIQLKKDYAFDLFNHKNPYTGLLYKDDPVFASAQVINEIHIWSYAGLTPYYLKELQKRWNKWLLKRYGSRDNLEKAWTDRDGNRALLEGQDPAEGTVPLPDITGIKTWDRSYAGKLYKTKDITPNIREMMTKYYARISTDSIPSVNDASRFCYELEVEYETGMKSYLRSIGVKIPVMGTAMNRRLPPASRANAEMDFTARHHYWDIAEGAGVLMNMNIPMVRDDPFDFDFDKYSTVGSFASSRSREKPMAAPEWAHWWPNQYRAEGACFMAPYGCLQDWDMLIHHAYTSQNNYLNRRIMWIAPFPDPAQMGPIHIGALLFQRQDVQVSKTQVDVGFSEEDLHYLQLFGEGDNRLCPADWLAPISMIGNRYFAHSYDGNADVVIASGRSSSASYAKAKHAIVFADNPWPDLYNKGEPDLTRPLLEICPELKFERNVATNWSFNRTLQMDQATTGLARVAIRVDSLPKDALAFGISADGSLCLGYIDKRFCGIADIRLATAAFPDFLYRVYLAGAKHWRLPGADKLSASEFVSDTGELRWNFTEGFLTINTPRSQGAVGFLSGRDLGLQDVRITEIANEFSSFMLSSLDGTPLNRSDRILVLAVGKAENTGQRWMNKERTRLMGEGYGTTPVLIDPVTAQLLLKTERDPGGMKVYALDGAGKRIKEVQVKVEEGGLAFSIGREYATIYYEICSKK